MTQEFFFFFETKIKLHSFIERESKYNNHNNHMFQKCHISIISIIFFFYRKFHRLKISQKKIKIKNYWTNDNCSRS